MVLNLEWRHRFLPWRDELPRHFYRPLGSVALEGFVTKEQLTPGEALRLSFAPMPIGTAWGGKWEYGWFRGVFELPAEGEGKRIVLAPNPGAESIIFVDGVAAGARDRHHSEITLTQSGVPGTRYEVLMESYAGHGPRNSHAGPTPPDRETVPEPGPTQAIVGETTFGIWQEEVYQLWLDVETLFQLREALDENSLRVAEIDRGLRDFTLIVDFELPQEEMLATVRTCRERLGPLLACTNGSTAPEMFAFGHSHIDVAWLWHLAETERKMGRTMATQLALMAEYPEYRFLQSQPHLYWMLQRRYPEIYRRIKEAFEAGQFIPEGGAWVEPDTNITGGESLIRQFIHGKRFFQDEFGVDCEMLWLPDVFGYSGALPQIMRGCGVKYFSTQKIFWAYHGGDPFPYNTFIWEGIDGSEVFVHLHNDYNARVDVTSIIGRWNERVQKDGFSTRLYPFGYGDGGGGPTRDHLEFARRLRDLEGAPKVRVTTPQAYFADQQAKGWPQERYVGELYFQCHRGVLTSQAKTKQGNRKSEFALRRAELWGVAARALAGFEFTALTLDGVWKGVLLNQFHDILPGSSIARVYDEAEALYAEVISEADRVASAAAGTLLQDASALTVFNDLSWQRSGLVALPVEYAGARDDSGASLPVQAIGDRVWAEVSVPSCGWTTLHPAPASTVESELQATPRSLENSVLRVEFNERGEITSLVDKTVPLGEMAAGPGNRFEMYKDVPSRFDAWDIDSMYEQAPVALDAPAAIEVVSEGPIVATLRITRRLHNSTMVQEVSLTRGSRRLDFRTTVDWQERHKLLKVAFPVRIHSDEAAHEIQFGYIKRPNHRSRPFDADRFEVPNHKWTALMEENRGCAVLNDCKYGVNVVGDTIKLTLLKSALAPDSHADQGEQTFTYALYVWQGPFADSDVVRQGYDLNAPLLVLPGDGGTHSLFSADAPSVIIETVKPAEDGSEDIIVRLYESKRMAVACSLATALPVVSACCTDMLERAVLAELPVVDGAVALEFRPFEVKTVRLRLSN
ncbi:MAG: glycosyl hydrolase-related protein [Anaerolineae bacterium]|nr:glycosyl hydrolase-related protein [Anaerolineae bacterium]